MSIPAIVVCIAQLWHVVFRRHGAECVRYILKNGEDSLCGTGLNHFLHAAHSSLEMLETLLQAIDIHEASPQELRERIIRWQHKLVEDHRMGAMKMLGRFLMRMAELGSV